MIHIITGTKAQLIKIAPILKQLSLQGIEYNHISTGQHKATMDEIAQNFGIKQPDIELYQGKDITSVPKMLFWSIRILWKTLRNKKKIFKNDKNGIVLVHGDTFSAALGALMGRLAGLKVGHVEAGLRSFNIFQPFPEELTRLITFRLSHVLFCPGETALANLKKYRKVKINTIENTLLDSLRYALTDMVHLKEVAIPDHKYGVVSVHRFENFNNKKNALKIVNIIHDISKKSPVIFIMHKITEAKLTQYKLLEQLANNPNIELRGRYDYFSFIKLLNHSEFLASDGGSNQEECFYLGKPLLILRNVSERNEGLGHNAIISNFDDQVISSFLDNIGSYTKDLLSFEHSPSDVIIDFCKKYV